MGLDLIVEGAARPGHEAEWRRILERSFRGEEPSEADVERLEEISIPAHERLGAPRVGQDSAADAWILEAREAKTPEEVAATLEEFKGYHVVALVASDGVPRYSHGGLYEGLDETSFRGSFLSSCKAVLDKKLLEQAWEHKLPDEAVSYGRALLAAAEAAESRGPPASAPKGGLLSRLGLGRKAAEEEPFEEQLSIVRAAGRWFIFWGERGHPIRAWF